MVDDLSSIKIGLYVAYSGLLTGLNITEMKHSFSCTLD